MDITLKIDDHDLHAMLSAYMVRQEVQYRKVITTLDEVEHPYPGEEKSVVEFSLLPLTDATSAALYEKLTQKTVLVSFTNTVKGVDETKTMRLTSDIESAFGLKSFDGNRYYRGGNIQLRQR